MPDDNRDAPPLRDCPKEVAACKALLGLDVRVMADGRLVALRTVEAPGWYGLTSPTRTVLVELFDARLAAPPEPSAAELNAALLKRLEAEERAAWERRQKAEQGDEEAAA